jgi:hypothetical protein
MSRYDVKCWRETRNGKAYTIRIGSAWVDQKGVTQGELDALPIPDKDGRVRFFLEEPKARNGSSDDRSDHPAKGIAERKAGGGSADLPDDEIPF